MSRTGPPALPLEPEASTLLPPLPPAPRQVLGTGSGVYDPAVAWAPESRLINTFNPALRDTVTLLPRSWVYIRYLANNPGIWPFHCHILWHMYMGQQMYFAEGEWRWAWGSRCTLQRDVRHIMMLCIGGCVGGTQGVLCAMNSRCVMTQQQQHMHDTMLLPLCSAGGGCA